MTERRVEAYQCGSGHWYIVERFGANGKHLVFLTRGYETAEEAWADFQPLKEPA